MNKSSIRTLVITLVGIVAIVAISWLLLGINAQKTSREVPADWSVYSSSSLGFSISYPSDWKYEICGPQCVGWSPKTAESGQLALGAMKSQDTIDNLLESAKDYIAGQKTIKTENVSWLQLTLKHPTTGAIVVSNFVTNGPDMYEFGTAATREDVVAIYDTMLYSFKLLK